MTSNRLLLAAFTLAVALPGAAAADVYTLANFSGGVSGGNANVSSPFNAAGITQGMTFSGSFVYDNNLIPGGGTGFVNVVQSTFPDFAQIPPATAFNFNLGSLNFTAANNTQSPSTAIQYKNGAFNGFVYFGDFSYSGSAYQLQIQGGSLAVYALQGGAPDLSKSYVNGYVNIGNGAVTNKVAYVPPAVGGPGGVPEPATWAMLILGFGMAGTVVRRRRAFA